MSRPLARWGFVIAVAGLLATREARAQGPTIDSGLPDTPGAGNSMLGTPPGAGGGSLGTIPGGQVLGGRPGASVPRVPTSVSNPSDTNLLGNQGMGIVAPPPQPTPSAPLFGSLSLPEVVDYEGPPEGMTIDQAIDLAIRNNLDLRAKFFEIPQAEADILQAGLRANPIFYADGQLVPYGKYTRQRPGGQTQYDVNVSYPLDLSRKRQARTLVATRAKRVLEAQYQDAVRGLIDQVYSAYVDVLAARQTLRYTEKSVEGLQKVLKAVEQLYKKSEETSASVSRAKIQVESARLATLDAEEKLRKTKRALSTILNIVPEQAEGIDLHGTLLDRFPPPPPREELRQIALNVRPDLVSFRLGIKRAEADVRLALANRFTDVYMLYQPYTLQDNTPFGLKSPTSWALGVTVPLPVYNRNQGAIQRAKLNVTQTQIQLATVERQVITDVEQALREYEVTRVTVERIERDVLPFAEQVRADTFRLYQGGEVNVIIYLNAEREYNDTVKQYLDSMERHRRSMFALNTTLGQRVMP